MSSFANKRLRIHQIENESAFQVVSGFDANLVMMSIDDFQTIIFQKLDENHPVFKDEDDSVCGETSFKIYDAVALQVNHQACILFRIPPPPVWRKGRKRNENLGKI